MINPFRIGDRVQYGHKTWKSHVKIWRGRAVRDPTSRIILPQEHQLKFGDRGIIRLIDGPCVAVEWDSLPGYFINTHVLSLELLEEELKQLELFV